MPGSGSEILVYLGASEAYVGAYETTETYELHSISCEHSPAFVRVGLIYMYGLNVDATWV
jgi:hypothetical protein|eukprot:COSAG02_NODE_51_length_44689_cov_29.477361_29_plen_60_part_00